MALTVLDASVVIAVLDADDPHHVASVAGLRALVEGGAALAIPASAYAEVLVQPLRASPSAVQVVDRFLEALPCRIAPIDATVAIEAARLRAAHGPALRLPDALVIATAVVAKAARIVTADRRWPQVDGMSIQLVGEGGS